jgi:hypothetical protein
MAKLVNVPKRQPKESLKKLLGNARKQYAPLSHCTSRSISITVETLAKRKTPKLK